MKRFTLALVASAALVFGFGAIAQAQYGSASATFDVASAAPGQTVTLTITGCTPGETLTVTLDGAAVGTTTCSAVDAVGTGALSFAAPSTPGSYPVVVSGVQGFSFTTSITVASQATTPVTTPGGGLPATGSDGIGASTGIAIGLLAVGVGLFLVAQVRRRQPSAV